MKNIRYILVSLMVVFLSSCLNDKGNYTYRDANMITIEMPGSFTGLANIDEVTIAPKITSSLEGEITADNSNYTFDCMIGSGSYFQGGRWVSMNEAKTKDFTLPLTYDVGTYDCFYSVVDNRTGVETIKSFKLTVSSSTYEGWMVLCNEGDDNRVRLDFLSRFSFDDIRLAKDILGISEIPQMHNAKRINITPHAKGLTPKPIVLLAEDGAYSLDTESLTANAGNDLIMSLFLNTACKDHIVSYDNLLGTKGFYAQSAVFCVSSEGNVYVWNVFGGLAFQMPINTSERGKDPEYRVSPFIGVPKGRSHPGTMSVFFDIDNHRFVGWRGDLGEFTYQTLTPLTNYSGNNQYFNYDTGNMDLVFMEGSQISGGVVYAIMQDGSNRHIYQMSMSDPKTFTQSGAWNNVSAENFDKASLFAFSQQYLMLYYAYGNTVYAYDLGTSTAKPVVELPDNEEITCLKFALYEHPMEQFVGSNIPASDKDRFMALQYELIVGSYDKTAAADGGKMRLYNVAAGGRELSLDPGMEFSGFARIVDVKYRER